MGWWIGFQNPSIALVRLKWGCAALGKRWPGYRSAAACRSLALEDINIVARDSYTVDKTMTELSNVL